jgi:hypothetical protein
LGLLLAGGGLFGLTSKKMTKAADAEAKPAASLPTDVSEARGRAKLMHETLHGVLQVVHRDFFREDEKMPIPSQSLEDVFAEVEKTQNVKLRWLAVNTQAMNVDHKAKTDFDKAAVKALAAGEESFESFTEETYEYAGTIRLSADCLGCHLPSRGSNKDRAAGLVISMPLKAKSP